MAVSLIFFYRYIFPCPVSEKLLALSLYILVAYIGPALYILLPLGRVVKRTLGMYIYTARSKVTKRSGKRGEQEEEEKKKRGEMSPMNFTVSKVNDMTCLKVFPNVRHG